MKDRIWCGKSCMCLYVGIKIQYLPWGTKWTDQYNLK